MDIHWVSFLIGFTACALVVWWAIWLWLIRRRPIGRNYGMRHAKGTIYITEYSSDLDDDMAGADRP